MVLAVLLRPRKYIIFAKFSCEIGRMSFPSSGICRPNYQVAIGHEVLCRFFHHFKVCRIVRRFPNSWERAASYIRGEGLAFRPPLCLHVVVFLSSTLHALCKSLHPSPYRWAFLLWLFGWEDALVLFSVYCLMLILASLGHHCKTRSAKFYAG